MSRITAPTIVSAALMDEVCPPSGAFAAFNALSVPKQMEVFEWDGHDGGRAFFDQTALEFVATHLPPNPSA